MPGEPPHVAEMESFLAERGEKLLRTAILLTGSRDTGEDLLQAALERLFRNWRKIHGDPEGYLAAHPGASWRISPRTGGGAAAGGGAAWACSRRPMPATCPTTPATSTSGISLCGCCSSCRRGSAPRSCSATSRGLHRLRELSGTEPFGRLFNQGYILADAFTDARGRYVPAAEVTHQPDGWTYHGQPVTRRAGKMGKSLKNGISPDDMCDAYGADTLRLYEMAMGPLDGDRPWRTDDIVGMHRFLQRLWRLIVDETTGEIRVTADTPAAEPLDTATARLLHRTMAAVRVDFAALRFNTAIAQLITLTTHASRLAGPAPRPGRAAGPDGGAAGAARRRGVVAAARAFLVPGLNGKVRFTIEVPAQASQDEIAEPDLALPLHRGRTLFNQERGPVLRSDQAGQRPGVQRVQPGQQAADLVRDAVLGIERNLRPRLGQVLTGELRHEDEAPAVLVLAVGVQLRGGDRPSALKEFQHARLCGAVVPRQRRVQLDDVLVAYRVNGR